MGLRYCVVCQTSSVDISGCFTFHGSDLITVACEMGVVKSSPMSCKFSTVCPSPSRIDYLEMCQLF